MSTLENQPAHFHLSSVLFVMLVVMAAGGCATGYEQPAAPVKNLARLEAIAPVWVYSIDGQKVSQVGITGEKIYSLPPGAHTILVRYSDYEHELRASAFGVCEMMTRSMSKTIVPVGFVAEAGHTYYLLPGAETTVWRPHISETRDPVFQEVKAP